MTVFIPNRVEKTKDGRTYRLEPGGSVRRRPSENEIDLFNWMADDDEIAASFLNKRGWLFKGLSLIPTIRGSTFYGLRKHRIYPYFRKLALWAIARNKKAIGVTRYKTTPEFRAKWLENRDAIRSEISERRMWLRVPAHRERVAVEDAKETERQYAEHAIPSMDLDKVSAYVGWMQSRYRRPIYKWAKARHWSRWYSSPDFCLYKGLWPKWTQTGLGLVLHATENSIRRSDLNAHEKIAAGIILGQVRRPYGFNSILCSSIDGKTYYFEDWGRSPLGLRRI